MKKTLETMRKEVGKPAIHETKAAPTTTDMTKTAVPPFESDSQSDSQQETEEEDWIEYIKRSTKEAECRRSKTETGLRHKED